MVISFSHFLPRTDIMPSFISDNVKRLFPVFGSHKIEEQIKKLKASIHIYGHSHLNLQVKKGDRTYINNAFGYPHEKGISQKRIISVYET